MSEQCVDGFDEAYRHKGDFAHLTVARTSTKKSCFCGDACKLFVKGNKSRSGILGRERDVQMSILYKTRLWNMKDVLE